MYKTKQKDLILNTIKKYNKSFTINDIYNDLNGKVGLTTIYRFIEKLIIDNRVIKNNNKYEYLVDCDKDNHFYLKCNICGKMIHIDCDCIEELMHHVKIKHKFKIDKEKMVINGICKECEGLKNDR